MTEVSFLAAGRRKARLIRKLNRRPPYYHPDCSYCRLDRRHTAVQHYRVLKQVAAA